MKLNIGSVSGKRVSALVIILNGAEVNISTEFGAKINVGCRSPHLGPKFLVPNPRTVGHGYCATYFGQLILHFPLFVILSHFPMVKPR